MKSNKTSNEDRAFIYDTHSPSRSDKNIFLINHNHLTHPYLNFTSKKLNYACQRPTSQHHVEF